MWSAEHDARGRGRPRRSLGGMRIATWNVNSVGARLPRLLPWLEEVDVEARPGKGASDHAPLVVDVDL